MLLKFQKRAQALDYAYRKNGEIENDWIAQHLEYEFCNSNYQSEGIVHVKSFPVGTFFTLSIFCKIPVMYEKDFFVMNTETIL